MNLFSFGIVRGLLGQVLGTIAGMLTITVIRLIFGIRPLWNGESLLVSWWLVWGHFFPVWDRDP